jgi:hypothetical protein
LEVIQDEGVAGFKYRNLCLRTILKLVEEQRRGGPMKKVISTFFLIATGVE